jgi:glutamine cyclotransferase
MALDFITYNLINTYPHDIKHHTQGIFFYEDSLYESTGSPWFLPETKSLFGKLNIQNGNFIQYVELDRDLFYGEGSTIIDNKIYFLTYKTQLCFVYDLKTFELIETFTFNSNEGWGLTTDGDHLIMSDGTHIITYLDKNNYNITKRLSIDYKGCKVEKINDIQFNDNYLYANIYKSNFLAIIDCGRSEVVSWVDLSFLVEKAKLESNQEIGVLNGVAYRKASDTIFVTGKFWPSIYEIKLCY